MTLADNLLESLNGWQPATAGRHSHTHASGDWTVTVTADRVETVGSSCWEVTVARTAPSPHARALRPWAEEIARRTTGLLESLKVHEVDDQKGEAVLRSSKPTKKGTVLHYYDVHLYRQGLATVRRYAADANAGSRREQIAFALTNEVIAKLADDLIAE